MMPTEYVFSSTYPPLGLTPLQREEARRRVAGERPLGASSIASSSRDPGEEEGGEGVCGGDGGWQYTAQGRGA